ncbi:hypothetical protein FACS1894172_10460 [Spirochaetia bacterium]|nr:hypothetical protein FACS1894164_10530 [Spirochaetia bacterium]GHU32931.1 hypothetical protein FACS1894172_10460 [Spirochaetia bacterium]
MRGFGHGFIIDSVIKGVANSRFGNIMLEGGTLEDYYLVHSLSIGEIAA